MCKTMKIYNIILILITLLLGQTYEGRADVCTAKTYVATDTSKIGELPLPAVPSTLRTVPERAAYVLEHFWDAMDFRDTSYSRNRLFIEQNFANFASLFPHASPEALELAVKRLLKAAEADAVAYNLLTEAAEKYLCDPQSPVAGEEYYIPFLEEMAETPVLDEYSKERPRYLLRIVRKNARGTLAADFTFLTPAEKRQTLQETSGEYLLLLFMDPDCDHCREVIAALTGNEHLRRHITQKRLTLLVVDVSGNRYAWQQFLPQVPDGWHPCFDLDAVRDRELYVWRTLPALYLLDAGKRVLLKEPSLAALSAFLADK